MTQKTYVALMRMAALGQETAGWELTIGRVNDWLASQGRDRITLQEEEGFLRLAVDGLCIGDRYVGIGKGLATLLVTQYIGDGPYHGRKKWPWNTVPEDSRGRGRPRKIAA